GLVRAIGALRRAEAPPLMAVDRAQIALTTPEFRGLLRGRPLVPDLHALRLQRRDVRLAAQEPEELVDDRAKVELLRREQREALAQIEPHLVAEDPARAGAGAVGSIAPLGQDEAEELLVLLHEKAIPHPRPRDELVQKHRQAGEIPGRGSRERAHPVCLRAWD